MQRISRIDPKSIAHFMACVSFLASLLVVIWFWVLVLTTYDLGRRDLVLVYTFVVPFLYSIGGYLGGFLVALIYNKWAKKFGGIRFTLEQNPTP